MRTLIPAAGKLGAVVQARRGSVYRIVEVVGPRGGDAMREIRALLRNFNLSLPIERCSPQSHGIRPHAGRTRRPVQKSLFATA